VPQLGNTRRSHVSITLSLSQSCASRMKASSLRRQPALCTGCSPQLVQLRPGQRIPQ
jgi:hypothetical protein